jgi:hypothetical protein
MAHKEKHIEDVMRSQEAFEQVTVQSSPTGFGWVRRARHWEKGLSP